jgi:hypothetical protein
VRKIRLNLAITAGLSMLCGSSFAADMPEKAPVLPAVRSSSWTGFNAGANLGYGWGDGSPAISSEFLESTVGSPLDLQRSFRRFLHNMIAVRFQFQHNCLCDVSALIGRNPLVIEVLTSISLRVLDERRVNCIGNEHFYCASRHLVSPISNKVSAILIKIAET